MITASLMTADITITARGVTPTNEYNPEVVSAPITVTVKGYYRPTRTNTIIEGGDILKTDARVIVQPTVATDNIVSITVENEVFDVDGVPEPHWNPLTQRIEYIAISLRKGES